jgi:ribose transport system ATP-binding protein
MPGGIALEAKDLVKFFGPTCALRGASISLERGQAHALLGENGSGKSTLAKILCGVHAPDEGRVLVDGAQADLTSPADAARLGIGMVFQELSLAPHLSVVDNLFLGREKRRFGVFIDDAAQRAECRAVLGQVGLDIDPDCAVATLSMAEKQLLEVAKNLLRNPDVLIFDEPTARLAEAEVARLFRIIAQLKDKGIAIFYVTHHMREILQVCDQVSLIKEGRITSTQMITERTTEEMLVDLLSGGARREHLKADRSVQRSRPILDVECLTTRRCASLSMRVYSGEIVGIYGVIGCGREDLLRALVGLVPPSSGRIVVDGRPYTARTPGEALAQGVAYLCADRKDGGILANRPLRENLTISTLPQVARWGVIDAHAEKTVADSALRQQRVRYGDAEQPISTLSGGNQQKVLFGRAMEAKPRLMILEDPTAGIDVHSKQDIYQQIHDAARRGASFVWASSDIVETLSLCDRVYAMHGGRIVAEMIEPRLDDEKLLLGHVLGGKGQLAYV